MGFASELQLSPGSENGLKELEAKEMEGLGGKGGTLADTAGVRKIKDARKAFVLPSVRLLRVPVANHALRDGALTTILERTPQTDLIDFSEQTKFCCSLRRSSVLFSTSACREEDYLKFSQLPGLVLGEVEKFKDVHGFDGLVQSLESSNDPRAGVVVVERIATPLLFINLIVKLRIPRGSSAENGSSTLTGGGEKLEQEFLVRKMTRKTFHWITREMPTLMLHTGHRRRNLHGGYLGGHQCE